MHTTLLALALAQATSPAASIADKPDAVISQKLRMPNRYHIRIRGETRAPDAPPPLSKVASISLHIWRDGDRFRVDAFDQSSTPPEPNRITGSRHVTCEGCERDGYGITTTVMPGTPPNPIMVQFHKLGSWNFDYACTHFDWRFLGISNHSQCAYSQLKLAEDFRAYFKQSGLTVSADRRGDAPCLKAAKHAEHYDQAVWLSERDDFNPVFFEEIIRGDGKPSVRTTEIQWQKTAGGHLYPKVVRHVSTLIYLGTTKYESESFTHITHADFDSPIDPAVFTLAGLGLNENQAIGFPELKDRPDLPLWRNGRVDTSYTSQDMSRDVWKGIAGSTPSASAAYNSLPPAYPTESNWPLIVSAVAAAFALAATAYAFAIRRRRAAA